MTATMPWRALRSTRRLWDDEDERPKRSRLLQDVRRLVAEEEQTRLRNYRPTERREAWEPIYQSWMD